MQQLQLDRRARDPEGQAAAPQMGRKSVWPVRDEGYRIRLTSIRHGVSQGEGVSDTRESQDMHAGGYAKGND